MPSIAERTRWDGGSTVSAGRLVVGREIVGLKGERLVEDEVTRLAQAKRGGHQDQLVEAGGDDGAQAGGAGGEEAVGRILEGETVGGRQAEVGEDEAVDFGVGLLGRDVLAGRGRVGDVDETVEALRRERRLQPRELSIL